MYQPIESLVYKKVLLKCELAFVMRDIGESTDRSRLQKSSKEPTPAATTSPEEFYEAS